VLLEGLFPVARTIFASKTRKNPPQWAVFPAKSHFLAGFGQLSHYCVGLSNPEEHAVEYPLNPLKHCLTIAGN